MVGPSSSHTAGAVRIGMVARQLFGRQPRRRRLSCMARLPQQERDMERTGH